MTLERLNDVLDAGLRLGAERPVFAQKRDGAWRFMSYGSFAERVAQLAAALERDGIEAGDRVAIIANNSPEWAMVAFACARLGAVYVPMYEAQYEEDWRHIFIDSRARFAFVAGSKASSFAEGLRQELSSLERVISLEGGATSLPTLDDWIGDAPAAPSSNAELTADTLVALIYTSGTTGLPKGVMLSHGNLCSNLEAIRQVFPLGADDRSLAFLPWAHCYGQVAELLYLIRSGACIALAESVEKIADNLQEMQPTVLFGVPRIFTRMRAGILKKVDESPPLKQQLFHAALAAAQSVREAEAQGRRISPLLKLRFKALDQLVLSKVRARFGGKLRYASVGGAALDPEVARFIDNLGIPVYPGYGLTETSPVVSTNAPGSRRDGSAGVVLPGVRVELDTQASEAEGEGEIVVHGPNVMLGYHELPEENAQVFTAERGFRTGDLGRVDEAGYLFITGRIKEQYKLENGKYVVPSPLEEKLKLSNYIQNALIWGEDKPHNVALVVVDLGVLSRWAREEGIAFEDPRALLQQAKTTALIEDEIRQATQGCKPFERVRRFHLSADDFTIENGMLTPSLKVRRKAVLASYLPQLQALYAAR